MPSVLMLAVELLGLSARPVIGRMAMLTVAAMIFLLIGLAGLAGALWIVLARATDPAVAALIMGGAGFLLAGLMMLLARLQTRSRRVELPLKEVEAALSAFMSKQEGSGVWTPMLAAAVIGFLLTRRR
jgi:hypothetical protein